MLRKFINSDFAFWTILPVSGIILLLLMYFDMGAHPIGKHAIIAISIFVSLFFYAHTSAKLKG